MPEERKAMPHPPITDEIERAARPIRVQRRRTKGWRMPSNTVSVTRPGRWGNPFDWRDGMEISDGNESWAKGAAVDMFNEWLHSPTMFPEAPPPPSLAQIIAALRGKNLACFCPLHHPCHADVLLRLANMPGTALNAALPRP
jgi:Domain of unknown function (DUF4326)